MAPGSNQRVDSDEVRQVETKYDDGEDGDHICDGVHVLRSHVRFPSGSKGVGNNYVYEDCQDGCESQGGGA